MWDHAKVCERTVFNMHMALTNNIRFLPGSDGMQACSASTDGKLKARGHCLHQSVCMPLLTLSVPSPHLDLSASSLSLCARPPCAPPAAAPGRLCRDALCLAFSSRLPA